MIENESNSCRKAHQCSQDAQPEGVSEDVHVDPVVQGDGTSRLLDQSDLVGVDGDAEVQGKGAPLDYGEAGCA